MSWHLPTSRAVLALLIAASGGPATAEESAEWTAWYSVAGRVRTVRADVDLQAAGRISLRPRRLPSGGLLLTLNSVEDHPWKLYWIDPLGPLGEEVKVASVLTLPEASWQALEIARIQNTRLAGERHARWLDGAKRPRPLDGAFAFIVIGPASGRFVLEIDAAGNFERVANRLTDRWLSGPFDRFVGTWSESATGGDGPMGYWFWNRGERLPPGYEPGTYKAFAAALELLRLPHKPARDGSEDPLWETASRETLQVLQRLAPRVAGPQRGEMPVPFGAIERSRRTLPSGRLVLESTRGQARGGLRIERRTVFSSQGSLEHDSVRIQVDSKGVGRFEVEAGYALKAPATTRKPTKETR